MKNNKKYDRTFKLSLVAVSLSMTNLAWAADLTCSTPTGCEYHFVSILNNAPVTWHLTDSGDTSITESINVTVPAGNYQNVARTEN